MSPSVQDPSQLPLSSVAKRLLARAQREWDERQLDAAARSLASVLALAPDYPIAIRMLGQVSQQRGQHAKAIAFFRQVLHVWPNDADLHIGLGIARFEQGQEAQAIEHLQRACELAPDSAMAWFNLGEALGRHAKSADSVAALRRATELDPSHISARLSLARV